VKNFGLTDYALSRISNVYGNESFNIPKKPVATVPTVAATIVLVLGILNKSDPEAMRKVQLNRERWFG
jgi:hypothetical protein